MNAQSMLLFLHIGAVVVWVGGMFFAYFCLRPTALQLFDPAQRLRLWHAVLSRFFAWVWAAVIVIAVSGVLMFWQHGLRGAPQGWHLMSASGTAMIAIYIYVATVSFTALSRAVKSEDWKAGGMALNRIRQLVATNLVLGFVTIAFATIGVVFL